MESEMRFCKAYKDEQYVGKLVCDNEEMFKELMSNSNYSYYEITEEEYNSL